MRAKEDYLIGINFSRLLSIIYGRKLAKEIEQEKASISVGRVMTCVLGMVVEREREIRNFQKVPYYKIAGKFGKEKGNFQADWRVTEKSSVYQSPKLYNDVGFRKKSDAEELTEILQTKNAFVTEVKKSKTKELAPLLFNLAEIQNECTKRFKIKPDETLECIQNLYEKKLVTYPRTDARVLSSAVAKVISKNLNGIAKGMANDEEISGYVKKMVEEKYSTNLQKTKYVNDSKITDHYAIIPTGQGLGALKSLPPLSAKVYEVIARRFLSIFYPPAVYQKTTVELVKQNEHFFASFKVLAEQGYLKVSGSLTGKKKTESQEDEESEKNKKDLENPEFLKMLASLKKGMELNIQGFAIREGETSPPKRYTSGSMILAMENAGQLIEDEELRAQIKGSGIGTSATRAEILKKLVNIQYLALNNKTQVITPTLLGELIFEVVNSSIKQLLNPDLTASWEKGLTYVAEGSITSDEYMTKLENFVAGRTYNVLRLNNQVQLRDNFDIAAVYYKK